MLFFSLTCYLPPAAVELTEFSDIGFGLASRHVANATWKHDDEKQQKDDKGSIDDRLKDNIFSPADKEQTEKIYQISYHPNMTRGAVLVFCNALS